MIFPLSVANIIQQILSVLFRYQIMAMLFKKLQDGDHNVYADKTTVHV